MSKVSKFYLETHVSYYTQPYPFCLNWQQILLISQITQHILTSTLSSLFHTRGPIHEILARVGPSSPSCRHRLPYGTWDWAASLLRLPAGTWAWAGFPLAPASAGRMSGIHPFSLAHYPFIITESLACAAKYARLGYRGLGFIPASNSTVILGKFFPFLSKSLSSATK